MKWKWQVDNLGWRLYENPVTAYVFTKKYGWYQAVLHYGLETVTKNVRSEAAAKDWVYDQVKERLSDLLRAMGVVVPTSGEMVVRSEFPLNWVSIRLEDDNR